MSNTTDEEQRKLDYPDDYMAQRRKLWCDVYSRMVAARGNTTNAVSEAASAVRRYDSFFYPYDPTPKETEIVLNETPDWLTELFKKHNFKQEGYDLGFRIELYMDGETEIEVMVCFIDDPLLGTMVRLMHALESLDGNEIIYRVENVYNVVAAERFITSCRQFANDEYKKQGAG